MGCLGASAAQIAVVRWLGGWEAVSSCKSEILGGVRWNWGGENAEEMCGGRCR